NYVAMNPVANALLAAGASPAMVHAPEEAAEFARLADALTVNIGTLSAPWFAAMTLAAAAAGDANKPWVLDPVACFATAFRRDAAARLVALAPTVVRANASEVLSLAGTGGGGRGADAGDEVGAAEEAARRLARTTGGVVAVTGATDFVTDGTRAVRIAGGSPLMPRVTALGCALTGVVGAFLAATADPMEATVGALALFGVAGERAASRAAGPGSFVAPYVDALATVDGEALAAGARLTPV
ncbi:MAG: hydroxyethylthiazole kinase, partial [Alphaproteobacteria bacterium]|nr:hydroxyethylthiazole kinase [Alphaproteobacteria bacterium]